MNAENIIFGVLNAIGLLPASLMMTECRKTGF